MPKGYRTVNIPVEMVEEIENIIKKHPEYGYTSLAELIKDAIRSKLIQLKHEEIEKELVEFIKDAIISKLKQKEIEGKDSIIGLIEDA